MKSGNQIWERNLQRILKEYEDAHSDPECKGAFAFRLVRNTMYPLGALGPLLAPVIPMLVCNECGSAFTLPGFEENVSRIIATQLVLGRELLAKNQIKFLRQYFDLTQEALAKRIGVYDKAYLSKMESEAHPQVFMPAETQLRMKLVFAKMLGIKEVEKIYELADIDDTKTATVDLKLFEAAERERETSCV